MGFWWWLGGVLFWASGKNLLEECKRNLELKVKNNTVNNIGGICASLFFGVMIGGVGQLLEYSSETVGIITVVSFIASLIFWFREMGKSDYDEWDAQ